MCDRQYRRGLGSRKKKLGLTGDIVEAGAKLDKQVRSDPFFQLALSAKWAAFVKSHEVDPAKFAVDLARFVTSVRPLVESLRSEVELIQQQHDDRIKKQSTKG